MREIKFRVWHKDEMLKLISEPEYGNHYIQFGDQKYHIWNSDGDIIKSAVLMQYTGLKDKNGNEIYEGDILHEEVHTDEGLMDSFRQVFWFQESASWVIDESFLQNKSRISYLGAELDQHKLSVAGNIFQPPPKWKGDSDEKNN